MSNAVCIVFVEYTTFSSQNGFTCLNVKMPSQNSPQLSLSRAHPPRCPRAGEPTYGGPQGMATVTPNSAAQGPAVCRLMNRARRTSWAPGRGEQHANGAVIRTLGTLGDGGSFALHFS